MILNDPPLPFVACPQVKRIFLVLRELFLDRVDGEAYFFSIDKMQKGVPV